MTNDLTFFHQATMKICGSLDIDKAIQDSADYLQGFIPFDGIMMCTYEPEKGAIRILALSTSLTTPPWTRPIHLSARAQSMINATESGVFIHLEADNNPIAHEINTALKIDTASQMVLHLKLDDRHLGVVHAFSRKENHFTHEHARLLGLLHDPFAAAMANVIRHREVLHLKDLLADDNRYLQQELRSISGDEIIGSRYGLRDVMEMVRQVSPLSSHVMLTGETGVGKEVIANAIHYSSLRREGPFVKVNCGAFADSLLDSELFGHEKGAFTGAFQSRRGRFERAHGGTLFLDEVGELPVAAQVRLLRVLQDKTIERVGGMEPIEVDVRVIAATHRNLPEMVKEGRFREDLLFRLNVFPIPIPPLRLRKSDIPALVHHFIDRKLKAFNLTCHPVLEPGAMEQLIAYPFPGNVRELENMVERALIRHQSRDKDKPLRFPDLDEDTSDLPAPVSPPGHINPRLTLDAAMRNHIEAVLRETRGKIQGKDGAAAILGIHPSTLRSRMDKLGVTFGRKATS
jgi:transcriptional regulator with GAF, ATPase, and Fis domain